MEWAGNRSHAINPPFLRASIARHVSRRIASVGRPHRGHLTPKSERGGGLAIDCALRRMHDRTRCVATSPDNCRLLRCFGGRPAATCKGLPCVFWMRKSAAAVQPAGQPTAPGDHSGKVNCRRSEPNWQLKNGVSADRSAYSPPQQSSTWNLELRPKWGYRNTALTVLETMLDGCQYHTNPAEPGPFVPVFVPVTGTNENAFRKWLSTSNLQKAFRN